MQEISLPSLSLECFEPLMGPRDTESMRSAVRRAQEMLPGRAVWNVNSTATGGGVAEMLQTLLGYARGCDIDARWLVIQGDRDFFTLTKRIHNHLHGSPGDGERLNGKDQAHYAKVSQQNAEAILTVVRPRDIVLLHDPQTAGLIPALHKAGTAVIWQCHIGNDTPNDLTDQAWAFLRPYLEEADAFVFSRAAYVPPWLNAGRVRIIPPSISPFSVKNQSLSPSTARAILTHIGLLRVNGDRGKPVFTRLDGSPAQVHRRAEVLHTGSLPGPDVPLVVQVSRWDRLKDMIGVMQGFAEHLDGSVKAHLILAGPSVRGVADDPEGSQSLEECIAAWHKLPEEKRSRVQIVCLPMEDIEENAAMVNALQRHAAVIVQKSLHEGFGLTVTEAMWKGRPTVASAVGGIQDQIVDGQHGLLLKDPTDLEALGRAMRHLLTDRAFALKLGRNARRRAITHFLSPRHLTQYMDLFTSVNGHSSPLPHENGSHSGNGHDPSFPLAPTGK